MNKKTVFILIIFATVVFLATGSLCYYRNFILQNSKSSQDQTVGQQIKIENKKILEGEKPLKIDASYPYISGLNDFNQKTESLIKAQIAEFKNNSLENDEIVKKVDPESYAKYPRQYDFVATYETGRADKNVISVIFEIYRFEGGAHGNTNFFPLNYKFDEKKEIKLVDLYVGQNDYLQKISDYCRADLKQQMGKTLGGLEGSWIEQGTEPKEENFSIFRINQDNSLTFYFPQYQVASYAAGYFKVTMPR